MSHKCSVYLHYDTNFVFLFKVIETYLMMNQEYYIIFYIGIVVFIGTKLTKLRSNVLLAASERNLELLEKHNARFFILRQDIRKFCRENTSLTSIYKEKNYLSFTQLLYRFYLAPNSLLSIEKIVVFNFFYLFSLKYSYQLGL